MRVLVFGDSIAQGQWATQAGWVQRLFLDDAAEVVAKPGTVNCVTINLAIGGETTKGVINRLSNEVKVRIWQDEPVVLVFAVGVNDAGIWEEGGAVSSPEEYANDLEKLYGLAKEYTDKVVFIGLTPVEDDNLLTRKAYQNERIWQFEKVLRSFVAENGIPFVSLFETMQECMKTESLMVDGLHPNDSGHKLMYEQIKPVLKKLVAAR